MITLIKSLLDEVQSSNTSRNSSDFGQILSEIISTCLDKVNFVSLLCQGFENSSLVNNENNNNSESSKLISIIDSMSLSMIRKLLVVISLSYSQSQSLCDIALTAAASILSSITVDMLNELNKLQLQMITHCIHTSNQLKSIMTAATKTTTSSSSNNNTNTNNDSISTLTLTANELFQFNDNNFSHNSNNHSDNNCSSKGSNLEAMFDETINMAQIIEEFGLLSNSGNSNNNISDSNKQELIEALALINHDSSSSSNDTVVIDEKQISNLLLTMSNSTKCSLTTNTNTTNNNGASTSTGSHDSKCKSSIILYKALSGSNTTESTTTSTTPTTTTADNNDSLARTVSSVVEVLSVFVQQNSNNMTNNDSNNSINNINIDWVRVIRGLDSHDFDVNQPLHAARVIFNTITTITNRPFPLSSLLNSSNSSNTHDDSCNSSTSDHIWHNRVAQISLLRCCIDAASINPSSVSCEACIDTTTTTLLQTIGVGSISNSNSNKMNSESSSKQQHDGAMLWCSSLLYTALLHLSGSGLTQEVLSLFDIGVASNAAVVLIMLALTTTTNSSTNSGDVVDTASTRTVVIQAAIKELLTNSTTSQTSLSLFQKVLECLVSVGAIDLVVIILRIALKEAISIDDIQSITKISLSLSHESLCPVGTIARRIDMESSFDELLPILVVQYDTGDDTEREQARARLLKELEKNPKNSRYLMAFIDVWKNTLRSRITTATTTPYGGRGGRSSSNSLLSLETCKEFLDILATRTGDVLPEEVLLLRKISNTAALSSPFLQWGLVGGGPHPATVQSSNTKNGNNGGNNSNPNSTSQGAEVYQARFQETESLANAFFEEYFKNRKDLNSSLEHLHQLKTNSNQRENDIFRCIIHNLMDENRYYHQFPVPELKLVAKLFGNVM